MARKSSLRLWIYLVAGLLFLAAGITLLSWSESQRSAERRARRRWHRIMALDREPEPEKALAAGRELDPENPFVGIRMMRRQWQLARRLYQEEDRKAAAATAASRHHALNRLLGELEKTGQRLRTVHPPPAIGWRVENLLGAGYLMQALLVLDQPGEVKSCQALLHQAIACFKKAITQVDRLPAADTGQGNIPRWNLELLITAGRLARLALADTRSANRYDLRRNLTILLPGSSGYLAGEPPDSRVRK
ncbi:MAG: hypothetical protein JRJ56_02780 [Deltaproteobacteria bacterium]|nr:hypothetical protein [Deltaproteobacteria bacterium]